MAREGMNRDHQESEARCQQSSTAEGPVAYADLNVICAPPSEKNKSMNGKMMKTKNDFSSSSSSSSDEEKRVKNLGNPSVRPAANDDASLPSSSSSSSLIFGSSQEFLRRSECLSSTSLDMSACSSHGITVPSFEASFYGKPSSDNMFGPMPQEPDVRADILCSEFSDTSGTTASNSGLSYDGESSSFDDIAHVPQAHDACIAPDSFSTVSQGHSITNPLCELKKSSSDNGFFLSQKPDVRSTIPPQKPGPARCLCCRKKLGLLGFKCRCGDLFCALHRYSDKHNCRFDYRTAAKEAIAKANPVVKAPKIWKL